ncbi:hypothetical protein MUCCIDRAFT_79354 [Mucor lusitanicus CBS 277.49]|uniref:Uncharacterized protein n=1 Tax=Mucor lusitanicus CBS 277.49 TaxID=747725 RepID=A0A168M146_MUCCL|nr:hypothetical protein MUCCIDRAFT_79354 [Mucor lusitanicus CBS 277.49]
MDLKVQGHSIIGYCRKSKTTTANNGKVPAIYDRWIEREVVGTEGVRYYLLHDIQTMNKVALIVIESAGLTTNFADLDVSAGKIAGYYLYSDGLAIIDFNEQRNDCLGFSE